nr:MAG TPA: hypothetical protein [Caudoviricetes sp.]
MNLVKKDTLTSLELLEQINLFRIEEGKDNLLRHDNLLQVIRDEFEEEIGLLKIQETPYVHPQNKQTYPMFTLTLSQAKQVLVRESKYVRKHVIAYIDELEKALMTIMTDKDKLLLDIMKSNSEAEIAANVAKYEMTYVKPLENRVEIAEKTVEHKKEVISCLTDEFKLMTQRQFLNEIIRMKGNDSNLIRERWKLLYSFYEKQKKINLSVRFDAYNSIHKPKLKSKLQYIDEILRDIPTLYKVAVKTFEADFKDKLNKYIDAI